MIASLQSAVHLLLTVTRILKDSIHICVPATASGQLIQRYFPASNVNLSGHMYSGVCNVICPAFPVLSHPQSHQPAHLRSLVWGIFIFGTQLRSTVLVRKISKTLSELLHCDRTVFLGCIDYIYNLRRKKKE